MTKLAIITMLVLGILLFGCMQQPGVKPPADNSTRPQVSPEKYPYEPATGGEQGGEETIPAAGNNNTAPQPPAKETANVTPSKNDTVQLPVIPPAEQQPPKTVPVKLTDETGGCDILSQAEVSAACGNIRYYAEQPVLPTDVCRGRFEKGMFSLYIVYTNTGIEKPQGKVDACRGGQFYDGSYRTIANGRGCSYEDGRHLIFAGKKYLIELWNDNKRNTVCNMEQMEQLGLKLAEKLG